MPDSPVKPPLAGLAPRPNPPYYAVIFTSLRTAEDRGYGDTAERMVELAAQQPGYLGVESTRDAEGLGITVSYWESLEAISAWRKHVEHIEARNKGRSAWYEHYALRIAKVERSYGWARENGSEDPALAGNNGNNENKP